MGFPELVVQVDYTTAPMVSPTNWSTLPGVRRCTIDVGRQRLLNQTEVGRTSVTLPNLDRAFDPSVHAEIRPANHLREQALLDGQTHDLFRGFVRAWPQEWPRRGFDAQVNVEAEDLFALMARYELEGQSVGELSTGDHLDAVLTAFGWPLFGSVPPGKTWWKLGTVGASELGTTTFLGENLRFIDDGTSTIMAMTLEGNLLQHLLNAAERTEGGTFYISPSGEVTFRQRPSLFDPPIAVFGDAPGEFRYADLVGMSYDDEQIFNDVRVTRRGDSTPFVAKDQASIDDKYGPRTLSLSDVLFSTTQQAQDAADRLLSRHHEPIQHPVRMLLEPAGDSALWNVIFAARLGDKVTVRARPPGGGDMIELDCQWLGVRHDIVPPQGWRVAVDLAPTEQILEGYWYLGHPGRSELGTTTVLA